MHSEVADKYLEWLGESYEAQKAKLQAFCLSSGLTWDEDVFSDTTIKVYDKILKSGMDDPTPSGFDKYLFKSFKTNIIRERQYARNARNDDNYEGEVDDAYEEWYNRENTSEEEKLKKDLWIDYATLYLINKVEEAFDDEHSYLFRLKSFLPKMTYKKLRKDTELKNVRQKVVDVRNWLKDNVTKDEIKKAFNDKYGNLLE